MHNNNNENITMTLNYFGQCASHLKIKKALIFLCALVTLTLASCGGGGTGEDGTAQQNNGVSVDGDSGEGTGGEDITDSDTSSSGVDSEGDAPDDEDSPDIQPSPDNETYTLDQRLRARFIELSIDVTQLTNRNVPSIDDPLVVLGKELFFSKSLSFQDDVACATCHDPRLAGGDNLSLPVGVGAHDEDIIGLGRRHDGNFYIDSKADGRPNVPRNSPTTFNSALYDVAMFWDGRIEAVELTKNGYVAVGSSTKTDNGRGQLIRTPESIPGLPDPRAGNTLLEAQARFPVTSTSEMKGFSAQAGSNGEEIRLNITNKLVEYGWGDAFREAYAEEENVSVLTDQELVSYDRIAKALAVYQESQTVLDNAFFDYANGNDAALTEQQKRGALLFFGEPSFVNNNGTANCASCHSGNHFTDERFHGIGVPQFGRGKNSYEQDFGRYNVSRLLNQKYDFRTPSLLNVELTGPYGHTGAFDSLEAVVNWHLMVGQGLFTNLDSDFDFSLQHLPQWVDMDNDEAKTYELTLEILNTISSSDIRLLHNIFDEFQSNNSNTETADIVAFLKSLTSECLQASSCYSKWLPDFNITSVDGNRLDARIVGEVDNTEEFVILPPEGDSIVANIPSLSDLQNYDPSTCKTSLFPFPIEFDPVFDENWEESWIFEQKNTHDFSGKNRKLPIESIAQGIKSFEVALNTGSASAADIDGDCDIDIVMDLGINHGVQVFINESGDFIESSNNFGLPSLKGLYSIVLGDINSDNWPDLIIGEITTDKITAFLNDSYGQFVPISESGIQANRPLVAASLVDYDKDGDNDLFAAHWDNSELQEEVHLWTGRGDGFFEPANKNQGIWGAFGSRDYSFTPNFADLNNDGYVDLVLAADFLNSKVYQGTFDSAESLFKFNDVTNSSEESIVNDENGMGGTLVDYDNDGDLDWFVTSIYDDSTNPEDIALRNWGTTGNRLYENQSTLGEPIVLIDATDNTGVVDGGWGWGVCSADFNNDGWLDIFHVNGYGAPLDQFSSPLFDVLMEYNIIGSNWGSLDISENVAGLLSRISSVIDIDDFIIQSDRYDSIRNIETELEFIIFNLDELNKGSLLWTRFAEDTSKLFINNKNGTFTESSVFHGINDTGNGRGVICNDFDKDGDIDIIIVNNTGTPSYYENHIRRLANIDDNFVNITLLDSSGASVYGAKVWVESTYFTDQPLSQNLTDGIPLKQYREYRFENNFISNNAPELHFGLGIHNIVSTIKVEWPDGTVLQCDDVLTNQFITLEKDGDNCPKISMFDEELLLDIPMVLSE